MTKWADYLISAVRFNSEETHIIKVQVHPDSGDTVGTAAEMDRQSVVDLINKNYSFATIYKSGDGKWSLGAKVGIVTIGGVRYIKTRADSTRVDNLDDLPRF